MNKYEFLPNISKVRV